MAADPDDFILLTDQNGREVGVALDTIVFVQATDASLRAVTWSSGAQMNQVYVRDDLAAITARLNDNAIPFVECRLTNGSSLAFGTQWVRMLQAQGDTTHVWLGTRAGATSSALRVDQPASVLVPALNAQRRLLGDTALIAIGTSENRMHIPADTIVGVVNTPSAAAPADRQEMHVYQVSAASGLSAQRTIGSVDDTCAALADSGLPTVRLTGDQGQNIRVVADFVSNVTVNGQGSTVTLAAGVLGRTVHSFRVKESTAEVVAAINAVLAGRSHPEPQLPDSSLGL